MAALLIVAVGCGFATGFGAPPAGASRSAAPSATPRARRVLIIAAPRLSWDAVQRWQPPNLMRLFAHGSVAMLSIRADGPVTTSGEGYLTLGAGNRMATDESVDGRVVGVDEHLPTGAPAALYRRATGIRPTAPIVALGLPAIQRVNKPLSYGATAGTLASALEAHGRSMAVIGNADRVPGRSVARHVGLAAIDRSGQVAAGLVGDALLTPDDDAPYGYRMDADVAQAAFAREWRDDATVLVELSDLERADSARATSTPGQGDALFGAALDRSDRMIGRMLRDVDLTRDLVMVVAPTSTGHTSAVTVFAADGVGMRTGWARSASTRRDGYVELTDVASTVLRSFGIAVPEAANDTPIVNGASDSTPLAERITDMVRDGRRAQVRDASFGPIAVAFIFLLVLDLCLAIACLSRFPRLAPAVRGLALVVLASLPMSYLIGLLPTYRFGTPSMMAIVFGSATVVSAAVAWLRRVHVGLPPFAIMLFLWSVLVVDISTGGHLQIDTPFGYSPIVAGRFAGFGNQAFSILALAALMVAASFIERRSAGGDPAETKLIAIVGAFFVVTLVADGHPSLGSDVGGVLAFLPAAAVAMLLFRRIRIRARLIAAITLVSIAVISAFAALDMSRPTESQTHLGRFASKLIHGQSGEVLTRKVHANLSVFTNIWTWFIPVAMIYFAYLTWRPNRTFSRLRATHREFHAFEVSALTLGVLAMLLNDSGVSMPAMMTGMVVVWVSYMVVDLELPPPYGRSPEPPEPIEVAAT